MADNLTYEQRQAVTDRGGKLLVSAAAGSGKTKVLVDRIISYIKDPVDPANIDDFLIITYTKAAAAELRGKIAAKLSEAVSAEPQNRHLQRQLQRLYLTKISTVHAFCGDILREFAYYVDIPADFRIAEENECLELQTIVLEKILDEAYIEAQPESDFYAFVDSQGYGRNDKQLPQIIAKLYDSARCHMDPEGWLDTCIASVNASEISDLSDTPWAQYLIADLHNYLDLQICALNNCIDKASGCAGMDKPIALFHENVAQLQLLRGCNKWNAIVANSAISYGTLTFPRKNVDVDMAARMKAVRDACKKGLQSKLRRFTDTEDQLRADMERNAAATRGLVALTRKFAYEFDCVKKRRRFLDFSDLEHKTLELFLGKQRTGATKLAQEVGERFREVMVDEYQDSNEVQDAIFSAITQKRKNCFMVGDVKQSIYQFRLADPQIFLKKYRNYAYSEEAEPGQGRKILLNKNFRSGQGVINAVNDVFSTCMSEQVGGLTYGEDEMLKKGNAVDSLSESEVELYGIIAKNGAYVDEANFVAHRIFQLLDGNHMIHEGDQLRKIRPGDIAILLRSPGTTEGYYIQALERAGIPYCTKNESNLLEAEEILALRAVLEIVDNPLQDIPLLAAITSKVFAFTADDLAQIKSANPDGCFYDALRNSDLEKAKQFVLLLSDLRRKARQNGLLPLLKHIFTATKIDSIFGALPDGEARVENLQRFYNMAVDYDAGDGKNLSRFLVHLKVFDQKGIQTAKTQANTDAVTVLSIHKSKGLEYPVVILPALSKGFNNESAYDMMLCDKDLGLGMSCVDQKNRVRYPSAPKRAVSAKILSDGLSEEMRILYVAMTRAKERLIMTYSDKNFESVLHEMSLRMSCSDPRLLTMEADCPGKWVLLTALQKGEAGAFFRYADQPEDLKTSDTPWLIDVIIPELIPEGDAVPVEPIRKSENLNKVLDSINASINYTYLHKTATTIPSKQTATQIKGRAKDTEVAEKTMQNYAFMRSFRKPSFIAEDTTGAKLGTAMHIVMQNIRFDLCKDAKGAAGELARLCNEGYITEDQKNSVEPEKIARFFATDIGQKLTNAKDVLREFKFSILEDASRFDADVQDEKILMQGVVDCAIVEDDGITVIDFKTDRISEKALNMAVSRYRLQVSTYADALSRIYQKPIKAAKLYFFELNTFVDI